MSDLSTPVQPAPSRSKRSDRLTLLTSIASVFETRFWLWLPVKGVMSLLERFAAYRLPWRR